jgi:hypothetical protein
MGGNGNAVAVWPQEDGPYWRIWASRFVAGSGWDNAAPIGDNSVFVQKTHVAMDNGGTAVAVWKQFGGTVYDLWARKYDAGTGQWEVAEKIESAAEDVNYPQIATDRGGLWIAVWSQYRDGYQFADILAGTLDSGAGWLPPVPIADVESGQPEGYEPQVAVNPAREAVVVWYQFDGRFWSIFSNRLSDGNWGTPEPLEGGDGDSYSPDVAIDANGNAFAVWEQSDGTRYNLWGNRYEAGKGWQGPFLLETDDAGDAGGPSLATDATGNTIVVWEQSDGSTVSIWSVRCSPGEGCGLPEKVETDDSGDAISPRVAMTPDGISVAVWAHSDGSRFGVRSSRYVPGQGWGRTTIIDDGAAGSAWEPRLAVAANGDAVAVWVRQDDVGHRSVWASLLR